MALYHLYSQSGAKDVPEHRKHRYQDVLDWLKDAANGNIMTDLPPLKNENGEDTGSLFFISRKPLNHKW